MKYRFILNNLREYPRGLSCRLLGVSRTGYYHWQKNRYVQRRLEEKKYLLLIRKHYNLSRGRYGLRRITQAIRSEGFLINKKRIYRLMRQNGIFSRTKKKFKVTTKQNYSASVSPNLLNGCFEAERLNQIWTSDMTYIWTNQGWMYLAVVLDVFNREIIGWSFNQRATTDLVLNALRMAINNRKPSAGIIFHSDRGSQYSSIRFRNLLAHYGFHQSMSGKGNCYDNAITESFFSTLKKELIYLSNFETRDEAATEIFEFIEIFYNRKRLHSALDYKSPIEFKMKNLVENEKEVLLINNTRRVAYLGV